MTEEKTQTNKNLDEEYISLFKNEYESSPFWKQMGIEMDQLDQNHVRIKMPMTPNFLNVNGSVHGGVTAALLDSIMGVTLRHKFYEAKVATVSLTTQFIAPVFVGTIIYATAKVVHSGRRIASLEAKLESETGELLAGGIGTFMIWKTEK
ncbi:Putative esterase Rv1847 [Peribacillus sp. Bi96]|uniref:PaaI family thioesterase n=1 Tax=unclassified Peribacillus TaxID=2675266 RepID=UPI001D4495B8|nr:PaaI family thioesterase [Peribacillus sp. Bi96]CAH0130674.1 Putative esterase Rv1847 [Peribacillus sp. Bi96]